MSASITAYAPPARYRAIAEIYTELGHTYMQLAREAEQQHKRADRFYAAASQAFETALRDRPGVGPLWSYLGESHEAQAQYDSAMRDYLEAARATPEAAGAALLRAYQWLTPSRARAWGSWLNTEWGPAMQSLQLSGAAAAALYNFLGQYRIACGEYSLALGEFERALAAAPDDAAALEGLGQSYLLLGDVKEATRQLQRAVDAADRDTSMAERAASARLSLIAAFTQQEHHADARAVADTALRKQLPYASQFCVALSRSCLRLHLPEAALDAAERALKCVTTAANLDATRVEALACKSAALVELHQYAAALQSAEMVLKQVPTHLDTIRVKVRALVETGRDRDQALRLLQVYLDQRPDDAEQVLLYGRLLRQAGHPPVERIELLERAIGRVPTELRPKLMIEVAEAHLERPGGAQQAMHILEDAVRQDAQIQTAEWWRVSGDALRDMQRLEDAVESYRAGVALDSGNLELLEHLAAALYELGDSAAAIQTWRAVLEHDAERPDILLRLSESLLSQEDFTGALEAAERAVGLDLGGRRADALLLKAESLKGLRAPATEIARALHAAGVELTNRDRYLKAADLLRQAASMDATDATIAWDLAEALRMASYVPNQPKGLDPERLQQSLIAWHAGATHATPDRTCAWAYLTRALLSEAQANLARVPERPVLWWQGIIYVERALALDDGRPQAWLILARLHRLLQNEACALQACIAGLERDPRSVDLLAEKEINLSNGGAFAAALGILDQLKKLRDDTCIAPREGYIYLHEGRDKPEEQRYDLALARLSSVVQAHPNDPWALSQRAMCYQVMRRTDAMVRDLRTLWNARDPNDEDPLIEYASAAYLLSWIGKSVSNVDGRLINQAIDMYERARGYAVERSGAAQRGLGLCLLVEGGDDDTAERMLNEGVNRATNPRELNDFLHFDLDMLEDWVERQAHRPEALEVLHRIRNVARARCAGQTIEQRPDLEPVNWARDNDEQVRRHAESEFERVLVGLPFGRVDSPVHLAAYAGLARIRLEEQRWPEATRTLLVLRKHQDQFAEVAFGLQKTNDAFIRLGDDALRSRDWEAAQRYYAQALGLVDALDEPQRREADLYARMACVDFGRDALETATACILRAMRAYREAGVDAPGLALADTCKRLLREADQYTKLARHLQLVAENLPDEDMDRQALDVARTRLKTRT